MRKLWKPSLTAGVLALGTATFAPLTFAMAADMPMAPPQMQGEVQPPPVYYPPQVYSPQVEQGYPPPPVVYAAPPPPVYYADAAPPYVVWPGPYYYGPAYGYGPRWAYVHGGRWRR